jgi:hypothetical protein
MRKKSSPTTHIIVQSPKNKASSANDSSNQDYRVTEEYYPSAMAAGVAAIVLALFPTMKSPQRNAPTKTK